jgi:hypothetical protein
MLLSRTQKRGQVFLIGASLFIILILGLTSFSNYIESESGNYRFDEIAKNVKNEMVRVVEYDISNGDSSLEDFINKTSVYLRKNYPDASFIFIYGEETNINFLNYASSNGKLIKVDGVSFQSPTNGLSENLNNMGSDTYTIKLNGVDYIANVYPSIQVYFAIEQIEKNEAFVGFA